MERRAVRFLFVVASLACASAQVVPVGGVGQHLIARFYAGIDCTTAQPTGFGTAALYIPVMTGVPKNFLFQAGSTVQDVTTATITGVFGKVQFTQVTNYNIINTFLSPNVVTYYYHPGSSPKDWTDFDGFQTGQVIGTYNVDEDMFTTLGGSSFGIVTGPFASTEDFVLPDGSIVNLARLMPGGITAFTTVALGTYVSATQGGAPQVVDLTASKGPFKLGSCAVMTPFSGTLINPATQSSSRGDKHDH